MKCPQCNLLLLKTDSTCPRCEERAAKEKRRRKDQRRRGQSGRDQKGSSGGRETVTSSSETPSERHAREEKTLRRERNILATLWVAIGVLTLLAGVLVQVNLRGQTTPALVLALVGLAFIGLGVMNYLGSIVAAYIGFVLSCLTLGCAAALFFLQFLGALADLESGNSVASLLSALVWLILLGVFSAVVKQSLRVLHLSDHRHQQQLA